MAVAGYAFSPRTATVPGTLVSVDPVTRGRGAPSRVSAITAAATNAIALTMAVVCMAELNASPAAAKMAGV
jgi:hypothetical protein